MADCRALELPTVAPHATVLGSFFATDAAYLCSLVAAQLDRRFVHVDVSLGSKIGWPEIADQMTAASGRPWTQQQCQRLWRFCAYGVDVGVRKDVLPDSDGEDDRPDPRRSGLPVVGARDVADAVHAMRDRVAAAAVEAVSQQRSQQQHAELRGGGCGGAHSPPSEPPAESDGVGPASLPGAAHAVIDAALAQALGGGKPSPSTRRSAYDMFAHANRGAAEGLVRDKLAGALGQLQAARMAAMAAHPGDPAAAAAVQLAAHNVERAQLLTWESIVQVAWAQRNDAIRRQYDAAEAEEDARWGGEAKAARETYAQAYRFIALHPALAALSGGGASATGSGGR